MQMPDALRSVGDRYDEFCHKILCKGMIFQKVPWGYLPLLNIIEGGQNTKIVDEAVYSDCVVCT